MLERPSLSPRGSPVTSAAAPPSAKIQEREHLLEIRGLLEQRKLEADHEHPRLRLGAHDVAGEAERVERAVAPEADAGPLDGWAERQPLDQREVDAWRRKPGARHQEQVRDVA